MRVRGWAWAAVAIASAAPLEARAHDFQCDATITGSSAPVGQGATPAFRLDAFPATLSVVETLTNVAAEPSVVQSFTDGVPVALGGAVTAISGSFDPGLSLDPGASASRTMTASVASYEDCLAMAGSPARDPAKGGILEAGFAVTHELGSVECRVRLVCAPPAGAASGWAGTRQFGKPDPDRAGGIAVDARDVVHVSWDAESVWGGGPGVEDVLRLDATGAVISDQPVPTALLATGFALDGAGDRILSGSSGNQGVVTSVAPDGAVRWTVTPGAWIYGVAVDGAGDVYAAGWGFFGTGEHGVVLKIDRHGNVLWTADVGWDGWGVAVAPDGAVYAALHSLTLNRLAKLDGATGAVLWTQDFGIPGETGFPEAIGVGLDGGAVVAGYYTTNGMAFVGRWSADGTPRWMQTLSAQLNQVGFRRLAMDGDDAVLNGWTVGDVIGGPAAPNTLQALVARYAPDGTAAWATVLGPYPTYGIGIGLDGHGDAFAGGATFDAFPGFTNAGQSGGQGGTDADAYVAKLSPAGVIQ